MQSLVQAFGEEFGRHCALLAAVWTGSGSTLLPANRIFEPDATVSNEKRGYQRTARMITSGGKQKPAKAGRGTGARRERRVLMTTVCLLRTRSQQMQQRPL